MRLEKEGDGRYRVITDQDWSAGLVLGGRRRWIGEARDGDMLGVWSTRAQAIRAVLDHTQDPLWTQMAEVARAIRSPMPSDLRIDRHTLRAWRGETDFLWIITDIGSHTLALDAPYRNPESLRSCLDPDFQMIRAYLVPARTTRHGGIVRLSRTELRRLAG